MSADGARAKLVIVFHVIAYGLAKFVFDDLVTIHFLHLYAVLFVIEVLIMLAAGRLSPRTEPWTFLRQEKVDLSPWRLAVPAAVTLLSLVVAIYLVFSPLGVAGDGPGWPFLLGMITLLAVNFAAWGRAIWKRPQAS